MSSGRTPEAEELYEQEVAEELERFALIDSSLEQALAAALKQWPNDYAHDFCQGQLGRIFEQSYSQFTRPAKPDTYRKERILSGLRTRVFERDAYRCRRCGGWHQLTVDHIVPESKGGTLDFDNLQTLCQSCNSKKGTGV